MIRLKQLLFEISNIDIKRCLDKIENNDFRLIGVGDNGRVYEINGEDKAFKITNRLLTFQAACHFLKVTSRLLEEFHEANDISN